MATKLSEINHIYLIYEIINLTVGERVNAKEFYLLP